jgi:hypothetical protein
MLFADNPNNFSLAVSPSLSREKVLEEKATVSFRFARRKTSSSTPKTELAAVTKAGGPPRCI